jgi:hypothetical protein
MQGSPDRRQRAGQAYGWRFTVRAAAVATTPQQMVLVTRAVPGLGDVRARSGGAGRHPPRSDD